MSQLMADILSRGAASLAGLFLLGATTLSLMRTVVIPRALRSAISDAVSKVVVGIARGIARLRRSYPRRDSTLAWTGPTIIIAQLVTWLLLYLLAYGLLIYGVSGIGLRRVRPAGRLEPVHPRLRLGEHRGPDDHRLHGRGHRADRHRAC